MIFYKVIILRFLISHASRFNEHLEFPYCIFDKTELIIHPAVSVSVSFLFSVSIGKLQLLG
jgi:hypothetical protein